MISTIHAQPAPQPQLPPIDSARIAQRLVDALKPAKGERAILTFDPTYYPELASEIENRLKAAGVSTVTKFTFSDAAIAGLKEAEVVAKLRPDFEKADIFLWLPGRNLGGDRRWERLLDTGHARCIHFHWIGTLAGKGPEEIGILSSMYQRAILDSDSAALSREQDRLISLLRGKSIHITAPNGTDLRMNVPAAAWFHKNDGDISPAGARRGKSVRDREMEFPSGALRFIPDAGSVEGKLVTLNPATGEAYNIEFREGRATGLPPDAKSLGGDIDKVGEVVIGTNPLLVPTSPMTSGELPYYGYGSGYVRISLGDNWESGGTLRVPGTINLWLFLEGASVDAGPKAVIKAGKIQN
ncbi:MAG: hypothetical protein HY046_12710 [Acidobacteria bacterium]|nr:hypothetical protein [Acidobacteriota bacterium]